MGTVAEYRSINIYYEEDLSRDVMTVSAEAGDDDIKFIKIRWNFSQSEKRGMVRVFSDTWERTYGELEWRGIVPARMMPWYFMVSDGTDSDPVTSGRRTDCFGVMTGPSAVCSWQYDTAGTTLWLDMRCGGSGVVLSGRRIRICTVLFREYGDVSAFEAGRKFCSEMCEDPLLPSRPVFGSNNWYYAVGKSSHEMVLEDARLTAALSKGTGYAPYCVIDDGWQKNMTDGPWDSGNERFPDMKVLADSMKELGTVPGIWVRYLADKCRLFPDQMHIKDTEALDPSRDDVIAKIKEDTERFNEWGYSLIKHDFSAFDMFALYGPDMKYSIRNDGPSLYDIHRTNAEVLKEMYRCIRDSSGDDTVIIGCDVPSHLIAGYCHLNRTGFDTSGRYWDRNRDCGVNALSHRMIQNGSFYLCDADCISLTGTIRWDLGREWMRALSVSGTPMFVSADPSLFRPGTEYDRIFEELREALLYNVRTYEKGTVCWSPEWMEKTAPDIFISGDETFSFNWYDTDGVSSYDPL